MLKSITILALFFMTCASFAVTDYKETEDIYAVLPTGGMDAQIHAYITPPNQDALVMDFYDKTAEAAYKHMTDYTEETNYWGPTYKIEIRNGKNMWCLRGADAKDRNLSISFKCRLVMGKNGAVSNDQVKTTTAATHIKYTIPAAKGIPGKATRRSNWKFDALIAACVNVGSGPVEPDSYASEDECNSKSRRP